MAAPARVCTDAVLGKCHGFKVLDIFGGINCGLMVMTILDMFPALYVSCELCKFARDLSDAANPASGSFPGISRILGHDVTKITRQAIKDAGPFDVIVGGTPCSDFSKMRLLPPREPFDKSYAKGDDPRPGLDGPKGALTRTAMKIDSW
jgi:site-specific DNA-cytosine methylase